VVFHGLQGLHRGICTCGLRLSLPRFQPWENRAWWWSRFKEPPEEWFYKAETGTDQVVLGIPWLVNFKPTINWTAGTITEVLEVPLHLTMQKVKKKTSWNDESSKTALCPIKEELNSRINRD